MSEETKVVYPEKLIRRVEKEYPNNDLLKKLMRNPNGEELKILSRLVGLVSPQRILYLAKNKMNGEICEEMRTVIRRESLYFACHTAAHSKGDDISPKKR